MTAGGGERTWIVRAISTFPALWWVDMAQTVARRCGLAWDDPLPATSGAIIRSPRQPYRLLAIAETVTWTLLIAGMVLKYVTMTTDVGVSIAGPIHGFVFLAYAAGAVIIGVNQRWKPTLMAAAVASAVVPYATIPFDRYLEKRGLLDGGWRGERTADPRDDSIPNRLLRVLLAHPIAATIAVLAGVSLVFGALLVVGPPGGRG
ncbi:MAG: hypothetical protein RI885_2070 [Actinomycetota bacterium]